MNTSAQHSAQRPHLARGPPGGTRGSDSMSEKQVDVGQMVDSTLGSVRLNKGLVPDHSWHKSILGYRGWGPWNEIGNYNKKCSHEAYSCFTSAKSLCRQNQVLRCLLAIEKAGREVRKERIIYSAAVVMLSSSVLGVPSAISAASRSIWKLERPELLGSRAKLYKIMIW